MRFTRSFAWSVLSAFVAAENDLGTAGSFAVLGASAVTNTGSSLLNGDVGVSPGSAVTGFPPGIVIGTIYASDAVAQVAQADASTAFNIGMSGSCTDLTGQDLGGLTLTPGVYCFDTSAFLTGELTLDAEGIPDAVFVFRTGSTLTTGSVSLVSLVNEAQACNVLWVVGSSATLGTGTTFAGDIIALASVTLTTGASNAGSLIALTGAVVLDTNDVSIAVCVTPPATTTTTSTTAPPPVTPTSTSTDDTTANPGSSSTGTTPGSGTTGPTLSNSITSTILTISTPPTVITTITSGTIVSTVTGPIPPGSRVITTGPNTIPTASIPIIPNSNSLSTSGTVPSILTQSNTTSIPSTFTTDYIFSTTIRTTIFRTSTTRYYDSSCTCYKSREEVVTEVVETCIPCPTCTAAVRTVWEEQPAGQTSAPGKGSGMAQGTSEAGGRSQDLAQPTGPMLFTGGGSRLSSGFGALAVVVCAFFCL